MTTVMVDASTQYEVKIGSGLLQNLGAEVSKVCKSRAAAIISDSNVFPLYGKQAKESLEKAGYSVAEYVFPAGEASKNGQTYLNILNFLAGNQIDRSGVIIALGGGVVGDMAGFAAATYLRGIAYVQVPTTLLAAVDSSVGGKTAIDLPVGKNLAGAFCQPGLVLCDTDCLNTLAREVFLDGCAEVIKYGVLYDAALFSLLEQAGPDFCREDVIARSVALKRDVVREDEFDRGLRMKLNLGHTFGHGIEANSNFSVSHGKAVAIGMAMAGRCAAKLGICEEAVERRITGILEQFSLPASTDYTAEEISRAALSDKKRSGGSVSLILPEKIGYCRIHPTPIGELTTYVKAGL